LDIGFLKTNKIKLRSEATSLFDVERSMFDVGRLSFNMYDVHLEKQLSAYGAQYISWRI